MFRLLVVALSFMSAVFARQPLCAGTGSACLTDGDCCSNMQCSVIAGNVYGRKACTVTGINQLTDLHYGDPFPYKHTVADSDPEEFVQKALLKASSGKWAGRNLQFPTSKSGASPASRKKRLV